MVINNQFLLSSNVEVIFFLSGDFFFDLGTFVNPNTLLVKYSFLQ